MSRRGAAIIIALALLAMGRTVAAQAGATLTLRSGEKLTAELVDFGGIGYTVNVNGAERQIPLNDVAVIDFLGTPMTDEDWAKFTGPSIVVLRNGEIVKGSLYDFSGTLPLKLTIQTPDGMREMASTDVARIVTAKPDVAVGTSGRIIK